MKVSAAEKNNISLFLLKKGEVIEVEKEENTTSKELWMELCSCGHKNHNQLLGKPIFFCVIKHVKSDFWKKVLEQNNLVTVVKSHFREKR